MKPGGPSADLQHRIDELRTAFPRISDCRAAIEHRRDGEQSRYALRLDIRWPQHQALISGPSCDSREAAVQEGFDAARASLTRHA